jgi:serine/threonine-protein kinase
MGAIYLGKKLGAGGFEKQVVLKQLLPEFTRQPEFIDLFLREARLSATLDHANIIHTIDLVTAGDEYFIVMEYLYGADLRTLLRRAKRRKRRFSASAGICVAREVLSALAYAHDKVGADGTPLKLIHRDVSPSNVLVSASGEVKLTDFGIAKASTHNSVFYRVKGKVGYMSPEQARSEPLDHRSDLYSLAVCLYEIITGERLFVHVGLTTSAEEMYSQPVPLVSRKVPGLPQELDKVMQRALAVDPDLRYQSAGEFQEALLRCAHRHGLLMSAPELAEHLHDVCGAPERWRDSEEESSAAGGTEVYDGGEGTEQINLNEVESEQDEEELLSVAGSEEASIVAEGSRRRARAATSATHLGKLQGLELTSLIKLAEIEAAGAEPLVDLDEIAAGGGLTAGDAAARSVVREPEPAEEMPRGGERRDAPPVRTPAPAMVAAPAPLLVTERVNALVPAEPGEIARVGAGTRQRWAVMGVILLAGIGVATAIGLTGPQLRIPDDLRAPSVGNATPR